MPTDEHYFLVMIVEPKGDGWAVRTCYAEAGTKVALSLTSTTQTANDITAAVGLEPTEAWSVGEAHTHPRQQQMGSYAFTRWTFCPDEYRPGTYDNRLRRLLELTEETAPRVGALGTTCDISIPVAYMGYTHQMWGVGGAAKDIARMAALGARLDIDLYASGPDLN
jgi:hypothetical protein